MYCPQLSVILRLADTAGLGYWCMKIDPSHGRPDLHPAKPWAELGEGDRVYAEDGTAYEVDRLVAMEEASRDSSFDLIPECREAIDRFSRALAHAAPR